MRPRRGHDEIIANLQQIGLKPMQAPPPCVNSGISKTGPWSFKDTSTCPAALERHLERMFLLRVPRREAQFVLLPV